MNELLKQLENALEHIETFALVGDWNMVKAWRERADIIVEKISMRGDNDVLH